MGGSLSAFVNMCLCLDHLHRAVWASICWAARQIQSQSFAHISGSLMWFERKPVERYTLTHLTATSSGGEQEHTRPQFSWYRWNTAAILEPYVSSIIVTQPVWRCDAVVSQFQTAEIQEEEEKARRVISLPLMCHIEKEQKGRNGTDTAFYDEAIQPGSHSAGYIKIRKQDSF